MTEPAPASGEARGMFKPYRAGIVVSLLLTTCVAGLALRGIFGDSSTGYDIYLLVWGTVFVVGPLALAWLVLWIVYMKDTRGRLPGKVHAVLALPPALALCIVPVYLEVDGAMSHRFAAAHPPVYETHVNLSGRPLWLGPDVHGSMLFGGAPPMPMPAAAQAKIISFTRYAVRNEVASGVFPYAGLHLRGDIHTYAYGTDPAGGQSTAVTRSVPLVRAAYPDLSALTATGVEPESALLVHHYFHYDDHVEMVPGLRLLNESTEESLRDKQDGLVKFSLSNRIPPAIVRLEINGQTLALATDKTVEANTGCERGFADIGDALVDLGAPLLLRWQTQDDPTRWHEASVAVPPFRQAPPGRAISLPSVLLYFTGDGQVAAERFQLRMVTIGERTLFATGLPAGVPADQVCGSARAYFPADVTVAE